MRYPIISILAFTAATLSYSGFVDAAELEKAKIKAEQSFIDRNEFIYQGNVSYQHGQLTISADKLIRVNNNRKKVSVIGNPVMVTFIDVRGEKTSIQSPEILYWEDSGEIIASGSANDAINIVQTSKQDTLTLTGNKLKANRKTAGGFSFTLTGSPTFFKLQRPQQALIEARAASLSSNGKARQTELRGNVQLRQGDSLMAAASMIYDGETELISAQQSEDGSQRVETEFFWQKEAENQDSYNKDKKEQP